MKRYAKFIFCGVSILGALLFLTYQSLPGILEQFYLHKAFNEAGVTIRFVKIGKDKVVYAETEKGKPTLLLVHGFQGDKRSWIPYIKKLKTHFHIIALDLPGHGGTDIPRSLNYDLLSQAQFLEVFVRKLGLKSFHLMGISMGGGIATLYASHYGDKVDKLVLLNPYGADTPHKSAIEIEVEKGNNYFFPESLDELDTFISYIRGRPLAIAKMFKKHLLMRLKEKQAFYKKVFYQLVSSKKVEAYLPKIQAKTLVLVGEEDQVIHASSVHSFKKHIPEVETLVLKNGQHVFTGVTLEQVITALESFLLDPSYK